MEGETEGKEGGQKGNIEHVALVLSEHSLQLRSLEVTWIFIQLWFWDFSSFK